MRIVERLIGDTSARLLRDPRVPILAVSFTAAIMFGALISPALPAISDDLPTATPANVGLILTVQTAAIVVSLPVVGMVADRVGPAKVLPLGLTGYAILGVACALAPSFTVLLVLRALQGFAYAGVIPVVTSLVSRLFDGEREVGVQGLLSTITGLAGILYPFVGGVLAGIDWRAVFLVYGALVPVAIAAAYYIDDPPGGRQRFHFREYVKHVDRRHLAAFSVGFLVFFLRLAIVGYVPFLSIQAFGATPFQIGLLITSIGLLKTVSSSQLLRFTNAMPFPERFIVRGGTVLTSASLIVVGLSGTFATMLASLSLFGVLYGVVLPLNRSQLTVSTPPNYRGTTFALLSVMNNTGKTVAPVAIGAMLAIGVGIQSVFVIAGVATLLLGAVTTWGYGVERVGP